MLPLAGGLPVARAEPQQIALLVPAQPGRPDPDEVLLGQEGAPELLRQPVEGRGLGAVLGDRGETPRVVPEVSRTVVISSSGVPISGSSA